MSIMFDLETLDTKPSAVVLGIGAVRFDASGVKDQFQILLDVEQQMERRRTVSWHTTCWWIDQDSGAQVWAFNQGGRFEVGAAFSRFSDWVGPDEVEFWAKSPAFDAVIWDSLCRDFKGKSPWHFRGLRDVRTLLDIVPTSVWANVSVEGNGQVHIPSYDSELQARQVLAAQAYLRGLGVSNGFV